jgi:hypothetical protein
MNSVFLFERNERFHVASFEKFYPPFQTVMLLKKTFEILMHAFCAVASYKNPASALLCLWRACQCNSAAERSCPRKSVSRSPWRLRLVEMSTLVDILTRLVCRRVPEIEFPVNTSALTELYWHSFRLFARQRATSASIIGKHEQCVYFNVEQLWSKKFEKNFFSSFLRSFLCAAWSDILSNANNRNSWNFAEIKTGVLLLLWTPKKVFHFLFGQFATNVIDMLENNKRFHSASYKNIHSIIKTFMLMKNHV